MSSSALQNYTPCLVPEMLPAVEVGGLYVHIPFCFHKCHYCDFYSITQQTPERMEDFVTLLLAEARMWAFPPSPGTPGEGAACGLAIPSHSDKSPHHRARGPQLRPRTIFFGGGTPTLLPQNAMRRLITGLKEIFDFSGVTEWTVEANPATVNESYCSMLRELGVDRLSFGAQSFDRRELAILERHHEPDDVRRSVEIARSVGFQRINVDLIFAIPGQSMENWLTSLNTALAFGTTHLSAYNLTYEPNTALTQKKKLGQIIPMDEATELAMLHETRRRMSDAGLPAYEISNFAAPGQECQHNLRYWSGDDYLALGPAAASHVQGHRWRNAPNLGKWEDAIARTELPVIDLEILTPRQRAGELAMLQLRLARGLSFADFTARTGENARQIFHDPISRFATQDLLICDHVGLRLTERGVSVGDAIAAEFIL